MEALAVKLRAMVREPGGRRAELGLTASMILVGLILGSKIPSLSTTADGCQ